MARYNLSIPEDLKRAAKAQAAREGRSLNDVINELLREWLRRKAEEQRGESGE